MRSESSADNAIGRVENHLPVSSHETDLKGAAPVVRRDGRDINAPAPGFAFGRRCSGKFHWNTFGGSNDRFIRNDNRQPARFAFEEIGRYFHLVIRLVNICRALERIDAQRRFPAACHGSGSSAND